MPRRPTLAQRRADELRMAIAQSAADLFVADGDTSATVERIAEAAGVSPRTFYRHFPVKEDVVRPLFRASSQAIGAALDKAPPTGDPLEVLVAVWTSTLLDGTLSEFDRRLLSLMVTSPQYRLRWLEADDELCAAMARFLHRRFTAGGHPIHHTLPAYLIVAATRHVFDHYLLSQSDEDLAELLRDAFRVVLAGIQATWKSQPSAPAAAAEPKTPLRRSSSISSDV